MKCALVGSRYFAAAVLQALRQEPGIEFTSIVAPSADDRLALAAKAAGLPLHVLDNPKVVPAEAIAEGTDLILAAHTHARVSNEALARSRLGGVGYHPSLLPRHRGIAAVEWTILAGDAVAGGSVYHLADGWDAGAVALQDWCFVLPGDDARSLWERALAPMGLNLLARVLRHAREHGQLPSQPQDPRFATRAPMIRRAVVLTDDAPGMAVSLVLTVIGPDRPGIVRLLAQTAERHGANWAASRLSKLAGEFAGMIHLEVPPAQADALVAALNALEPMGLRMAISRSARSGAADGVRGVTLDLIGDDRPGIVAKLTGLLAERGISIEHLHTELQGDALASGSAGGAAQRFKVGAHLLVPQGLSDQQLQRELGVLAHEMTLDVALGDGLPSTLATTPAQPHCP